MRPMVMFVGLVAACHSDAAPAPPDAMPVNSCAGGFSQLAVPMNSSRFASDGTSMFIVDADGLVDMPLAGGAPTMVAPGASALISRGDAVFYASFIDSSYVLHELEAGSDVTLGSVDASTIELAADDANLYVLGDTAGSATMWSLARAGSGAMPQLIASAAGSSAAFAVGSGMAAWYDEATIELVTLPGPSQPTAVQAGGLELAFVGATGYTAVGTAETSRLGSFMVEEFTPTQTLMALPGCAQIADFFGDSRGSAYYMALRALVDAPANGGCEPGIYVDFLAQQLCNFVPGNIAAQDDSNLYFSAGSNLIVVPKP